MSVSMQSAQKSGQHSVLAVTATIVYLSPDGAEGPVSCLSDTEAAQDVWWLQESPLTGLQITLH